MFRFFCELLTRSELFILFRNIAVKHSGAGCVCPCGRVSRSPVCCSSVPAPPLEDYCRSKSFFVPAVLECPALHPLETLSQKSTEPMSNGTPLGIRRSRWANHSPLLQVGGQPAGLMSSRCRSFNLEGEYRLYPDPSHSIAFTESGNFEFVWDVPSIGTDADSAGCWITVVWTRTRSGSGSEVTFLLRARMTRGFRESSQAGASDSAVYEPGLTFRCLHTFDTTQTC